MERQAGLGKSLEDVLDSVPPIEPTDPPRTHALFGIAPDDAPVANGSSHSDSKKKKKKKKSDGDGKQRKKSKAKGSKSKGKGSKRKSR